MEIDDGIFDYAWLNWADHGMGFGSHFVERDALREGNTYYSGFKFDFQALNQSTSNVNIIFDLEEETFEGTISGVLISPNVTWGDYYETGYDHMGYVSPPNGLYAYENRGEYSGIISGKLIPIGWHDPPEAVQYRINGTAEIQITYSTSLIAHKTISGGPEIINTYYDVKEHKTITLTATLEDTFTWHTKYPNLLYGGFNIWLQDYTQGPTATFKKSASGSDFFKYFEVLEWFDASDFTISGPMEIEYPNIREASFEIDQEQASGFEYDQIDWVFSFLNPKGEWNQYKTITKEDLSPLIITQNSVPSFEDWNSLLLKHGQLENNLYTLSMQVMANLYSNSELVASSNIHEYKYASPIVLRLVLSSVEMISPNSENVFFSLNGEGTGKDLVRWLEWKFSYKDSFGQWVEIEPLTVEGKVSGLQVNVTGKEISLKYWSELAASQGVIVEEGKKLDMKAVVTAYSSDETPLNVSNVHEFSIVSTATSIRLTGFNLPMKFIEVSYPVAGKIEKTQTDEDGYFTVPLDRINSEFELGINFKQIRDEKNYFVIKSANNVDEIRIVLTIKDRKMSTLELRNSKFTTKVNLNSQPFESMDLKLDSYLTKENKLINYLSFYLHFTEALDFYTEILNENLDFQLPLNIYIEKSTTKTAYFYQNSESAIIISDSISEHNSAKRPKDREYHEFSHYAMHAIYKDWPKAPPGPVDEVNHDGFLNPSTSDSYVEGFAIFMSLIMGEYYDSKWDFEGTIDSTSFYGSLEDNHKPWNIQGFDEEKAIAGILWDLYDGEEQYKKVMEDFESRLQNMVQQLKKALLINYDWNKNERIDRPELFGLLSEVITNLNLDNSFTAHNLNKDGGLDKNEFNSFMNTKWKVFDRNFDGVVDSRDKVKDKIPLSLYDSNKDGKIDKSEWDSYLDSMMKKHDENEDQVISYSELDELLQDNVKQEALEMDKNIDEFPDFKDLPEIITDKELHKAAFAIQGGSPEKSERVQLSLQEIWKILRNYHPDFKSVYDAFVTEYPSIKNEIDEIFISHGFWADQNLGNNVKDEGEPSRGDYYIDYPIGGFRYDEGEEVGRATNYQRGERRSTNFLPGHYIKTDNIIESYEITLEYYDYYALDFIPTRVYTIQSDSIEGSIYIPIPAIDYNVSISVSPKNIDYENQLYFTNQQFHKNIQEAISQGYYLEHDFKIIEPPEPTPTPTPITDKKSNGIPGFTYESILIGTIIGLMAIWYLRNK
jgi:hypothetical protein